MDVYIDKSVHSKITDFYEAAMKNHITLDETTINRKICRIYEALEALGNYMNDTMGQRLFVFMMFVIVYYTNNNTTTCFLFIIYLFYPLIFRILEE